MKILNVYRALLWFYPSDFRQQFSEEMASVFEQKAGDRFPHRGSLSVAFLLTEYSAIVKGAYVMWFSKFLPFRHTQSEFGVPTPILNGEEATKLRSQAIQKMVAAIADHDFVTARQFSDEEARLSHILEDFRLGPSASSKLP